MLRGNLINQLNSSNFTTSNRLLLPNHIETAIYCAMRILMLSDFPGGSQLLITLDDLYNPGKINKISLNNFNASNRKQLCI